MSTPSFRGDYHSDQVVSGNVSVVINQNRLVSDGEKAPLDAWSMLKLLQAMKESDDKQPISGIIQLDDVYWGW